jgi:hypothetical protein
MKSNTIKLITSFILALTFSINTLAQTPLTCTEKCCKTPVILGKTKVPKLVIDMYYNEYPVTTYESWHGYPNFSNETDWYGYNPNLYCEENPEYYVVEFTKDKIPHKVIYSKAGKKIATHKAVGAIPKAISLAITKSIYATWKLGKGTEEIFKDGDNDDLKVYKIAVEKGKEKHVLFFQLNGNLLKDKEIKS